MELNLNNEAIMVTWAITRKHFDGPSGGIFRRIHNKENSIPKIMAIEPRGGDTRARTPMRIIT
jgi:hypothetical protein